MCDTWHLISTRCFKRLRTSLLATNIQGRPPTLDTTPGNGVVSHGTQIGVFGFLSTTHAKQMHPRSLHAVWRFTHVYLHAQTAVNAGDKRTWWTTVILITRKTQRPPRFEPHARIKMAHVLGSPLCICGISPINYHYHTLWYRYAKYSSFFIVQGKSHIYFKPGP